MHVSKKTAILAAAMGLATATPSQAVTFIVTNGGASVFTQSAQALAPSDKVVTFNGSPPAGVSVTLNGAALVNGSLSGQYAQPYGSDASRYVAVYGGANNSATISDSFVSGYNALSVYLGSID